ncbi:2OG-Fe(II) oxygenase [Paucibacter sp. JuS9]|uniref:2OG-Fe(II) oxygenase n=1 Tax=Roseateles TaxID=93681 RepID=UPI002FE5AE1B
MKEELVQLIVERLARDRAALRQAFEASRAEVGVRYCVIDDLLPQALAERIHAAFPKPESMRLMDSFREKKYTSKAFEKFDPLMADITFAVQDPRVLAEVEAITGIEQQLPDSSLYAGGLSAMVRGHHLGPHIDNSHEATRTYYRTLNLLYYVTPGWTLENGGNLELWDRDVRRNATIVSRFNRLALMETTHTSWHSVSPVQADGVRCCVSNYYFSPRSPTGEDYFNVTSFSARPEQPLRRLLARADNGLRQAVRMLVPQGLGKKDVYQGPKK